MAVRTFTRTVDKKITKSGAVATREHWSPKQRNEAVAAYLILGNMMMVVASTGIPEVTLRKWKMQQWWRDKEEDIRRGKKVELSSRLSKVIDKTVMQLDDRVEHGDFFYNPRTGVLDRKPISAAQASKITVELIDRNNILDREVSKEVLSDEGLETRLSKLRDEMIKFARIAIAIPPSSINIIEGELL